MSGVDETEMKPWQNGIPLHILKDIEGQYKEYNTYSASPFSEVKKHRIAASIAARESVNIGICRYDIKTAKVKSKINMYGSVVIGDKLPGDKTITNFIFTDHDKAVEHIRKIEGPVWAFVWADWDEQNAVFVQSGFHPIGTKITTFAEIYRVYFKDGPPCAASLFEDTRKHPVIDPLERCTLDRMPTDIKDILPHIITLKDRIRTLDDFTDHYSNYNDKHSWGALSLRGYTADPAFITKPSEMSNKWRTDHAHISFNLQDTPLRAELPEVEELLKLIPGEHHRIRLMRLTPGGGELRRHTDQVDPDAGVGIGQLLRFHFPITTNYNSVFTMWNLNNTDRTYHMSVGELWSIDTRKPHQAINAGDTERIHLVVDVESTLELRTMLSRATTH